MKRHISGPYAKTNIMRNEVLSGIQSRASEFSRRCQKLGTEALDVYVSTMNSHDRYLLNLQDLPALLRHGLCFVPSLASTWHASSRGGRSEDHERVFIL